VLQRPFYVFCFLSNAGVATEKEAITLGLADGVSAQSRDIATNNALRQTVQQGVGTSISSETVVEQMKLIQDRIYSATKGYIKSYNKNFRQWLTLLLQACPAGV